MDSASQHEVVRLFATDRLENARTWARRGAVEVTAILLESDAIRIAPAPGRVGEITGPFEQFARGLQHLRIVDRAWSPSARRRTLALGKVRAWASGNVPLIQTRLEQLKGDRQEFDPWLQRGIELFWSEHSLQHGGLFDAVFLPELATITSVDQGALSRVLTRTQDLAELPRLGRERHDPGSDGSIAVDAYIASSLLRGRYHDEVSAGSSARHPEQQMHHPIRRPLSLDVAAAETQDLAVATTVRRLGALIVASAFSETLVERRLSLWLRNLERSKRFLATLDLAIPRLATATDSQDAIIRLAEGAGIEVRGGRIKNVLDLAAAAALGGLAAFSISPWAIPVASAIAIGGATALGSEILLRSARVGDRIGEGFRRAARLRDLARQGAGLLEARWEDSAHRA